jgi:hypothetical protein
MQYIVLFISALFSVIIIPVIHIHLILLLNLLLDITQDYLQYIIEFLLLIIEIFIMIKILEVINISNNLLLASFEYIM